MQSADLESHIQTRLHTLAVVELVFSVFFPACLAVTANTIRDLCVLCKQRLCAVSVVHHGRLPTAFSAALSISTVRPVMILTTARVRVCLHSRSHETWSQSSLESKIIPCVHFTVRDNDKDALLVV